MAWSTTDRAFKTLINKRTTSSGKAFYEEVGDNTINTSMTEVWSATISSTPSQAVLDGVAEERTLFTLTEDTSVGSQQCYYAYSGSRLKDWISDKYGTDYTVKLYQNNGTQIFPTDPSTWFFDYQTGILTFNGSTAAFSKPFKITAYRYIGSKGSSGGTTGLSGPTGIQGVTGPGVGEQGVTGLQGMTGPTGGQQGVTGLKGDTGIQGITGIAGSGSTGLQGQTGTSGTQGATGVGGGSDGATGLQGQTGVQGLTGLSGTDGATGIQGATGLGISLTGLSDGRIPSYKSDTSSFINSPLSIYQDKVSLDFTNTSGEAELRFSVGQMAFGQLDGGVYFGGVGVRENQWDVLLDSTGSSGWLHIASELGIGTPKNRRTYVRILMSSDGRVMSLINPDDIQGSRYDANGVWISSDYGVSWERRATSIQGIYNIAMSSDGKIQLAASDWDVHVHLYVSVDYGKNWTAKYNILGNSYCNGVAISSDGRYMASNITDYTLDYSCVISRQVSSDDFGNNWYDATVIKDNTSNRLLDTGVSMSSDGRIRMTGDSGDPYPNNCLIWRSLDYGKNWDPIFNSYGDVVMSANGKNMMVSGNTLAGPVSAYISHNYGQDWSSLGFTCSGTAISADGRVLMTCIYHSGPRDSTGVNISQDYGKTWGPQQGDFLSGDSPALSSDGKVKAVLGNFYYGSPYFTTGHELFLNYSPSRTHGDISSTGNVQAQTAKLTNLTTGYVKSDSSGILTSQTKIPWSDVTTSLGDGYLPAYRSDTSSLINSPFRTDGTTVSLDSTASGEARLLFSTGQLAMGQLDGGVFFGGVGIRENQWEVSSTDTTWVHPAGLPLIGNPSKVATSSDGRVIVAANDDVWITTNYGADWTSTLTAPLSYFFAAAVSSDGKIQTIADSGNGKIFVSTDYGTNWTERKSGSNWWWNVAMSSDGRIQTATILGNDYIYLSSDYGASWNAKGQTQLWLGNAMSSDGRIHIAAEADSNGYIYTSYDYGNTWTPRVNDASGFSGGSITADGKIQTAINENPPRTHWISTNYGMDWSSTGLLAGAMDQGGIILSADGRIWMRLDSTGVKFSEDHGKTWGPRQGDFKGWWPSMSSDGKIRSVSTDSMLFMSYADSKTRGNIIATERIQAKTAKLSNLTAGYVKSDSSGILTSTATIPWSDITGITGDSVHPLIMGSYYLWVDASGRLRLKSSAPSSESDGTIVGSQS